MAYKMSPKCPAVSMAPRTATSTFTQLLGGCAIYMTVRHDGIAVNSLTVGYRGLTLTILLYVHRSEVVY